MAAAPAGGEGNNSREREGTRLAERKDGQTVDKTEQREGEGERQHSCECVRECE